MELKDKNYAFSIGNCSGRELPAALSPDPPPTRQPHPAGAPTPGGNWLAPAPTQSKILLRRLIYIKPFPLIGGYLIAVGRSAGGTPAGNLPAASFFRTETLSTRPGPDWDARRDVLGGSLGFGESAGASFSVWMAPSGR